MKADAGLLDSAPRGAGPSAAAAGLPALSPGERGVLWLLGIVIVSYWYNLPVATYSVTGYNEMRSYDFVFLIVFFVFLSQLPSFLPAVVADAVSFRWLRFSLYASVMTVPTALYCISIDRAVWGLITALYLFHLWGFVIVGFLVRHCLGPGGCARLTLVFLTVGLLHGALMLAQYLGLAPFLWNERYMDAYGGTALSGTLGPNRVTPGMFSLLTLVLSGHVLFNSGAFPFYGRLLAWCCQPVHLSVLILTGSRTSWVALACVVAVGLFAGRSKGVAVSIAGLLAAALASLIMPDSLREQMGFTIEYRVTRHLDESDDYALYDYYERLGSRRSELLAEGWEALMSKPWVIPFGGGFNNRPLFIGNSAHNIYVQMTSELGVVGLFFYLSALWGPVRRSFALAPRAPAGGGNLGMVLALHASMLVSLFFGEHLYVYRPVFALLGAFILVNGLMIGVAETDPAETAPPAEGGDGS